MAFTDYGLEKLGSFMRGQNPTYPQYFAFGFGSSVFVGSQNYLGSEFYRKSITWNTSEGRPQANVTITSVEANGSNFQEFGIGIGSSLGSDIYTRNLSSVGLKNNTFDFDITFSLLFRRGR